MLQEPPTASHPQSALAVPQIHAILAKLALWLAGYGWQPTLQVVHLQQRMLQRTLHAIQQHLAENLAVQPW